MVVLDGVAVLSSCTDCSGSSGSDITEPGSPYSPASSASGSEGHSGEAGQGTNRPAWPWNPHTAATSKRPRADKCTNLETLIANKLHKNVAMPTLPQAAVAPNYNNNVLVNTEEKKSNTQTSIHCCINQPEDEPVDMPSMQPPNLDSRLVSQPMDCVSQISSIPKHIIHKAVHQQAAVVKAITVETSAEAKLRDERANQLKIHQGRITEYFKSQMKPTNGLKRDIAAWITRATEVKNKLPPNGITKATCEANENLEKYISYLSQTLNPKVILSANKMNTKSANSIQKNPGIGTPAQLPLLNVAVQKTELEKKPLPGLNPIASSKILPLAAVKKTEVIKNLSVVQNKQSKEVKSRGTSTKLNGKRTRVLDSKKSIAPKITKTQSCQTNSFGITKQSNNNPSTNTFSNLQIKNDGNTCSEVGNTTLPNSHITLASINNHMKQIFLKAQSAEVKSLQTNNLSNSVQVQVVSDSNSSDRVPSVNGQTLNTNSNLNEMSSNSHLLLTNNNSNVHVTSNSNLHMTTSSSNLHMTNTSNLHIANNSNLLVTTSNSNSHMSSNLHMTPSISNLNVNSTHPNMMDTQHGSTTLVNNMSTNTALPTVAVPPNTVMLTAIRIPQQNLQPQTLVHSESSTRTTNHIAISPTKINGQFVLPMVQNINGALVQIPSLMTKVGQNTVLPINSQSIMQRTDSIVNQQTTQMFINGTFLKINGPMHPNLPGLIAKQMTATSTTNVSYTVTHQKNISTAMPTVMVSKPSFAMNLNHPMFVSSSGFILNPVGNVVTTQAATNTGMPHVQPAFNGNMVLTTPVHPNVHINPNISNNITGLPMPTNSIPISPIKLGDINRVFLTPTRPVIPKMTISSDHIPNPLISNSQASLVSPSIESANMQKQEINISSSTTKYTVPKLDSIVNNIVSQANENIEVSSSPVICPQEDEVCLGTTDIISNDSSKDETILTPLSPRPRELSLDSTETDLELSKLDNSLLISDDTKASIDSISVDLNSSSNTPSVDSPVTEISKEIDEDSFLTINTSTKDEIVSCQKSPMLSQPKTIRFPAKKHNHNESRSRTSARSNASENKLCRWNDCTQSFDDSSDLLEHLQASHVNSQAGKETYTCLWQGCKVYNRPSCSRCWLERHVLSHGGNKLFRCIVDGCGQRFNTQLVLQRHVNNHFAEQGNSVNSARKSLENNVPKLIRRNGKKLRYRRQPWSARMFDFFDAGIMEGLQYRVVRSSEWRSGGGAGCPQTMYRGERGRHCVTFSASILARRINSETQHSECLITWTPKDVLRDEWILEKEIVSVKRVPIASLDASAKEVLYSGFCSSYRRSSATTPSATRDSQEKVIETIHKPLNGLCTATANGSLNTLLHCHNNNTKTDSLVTNTANLKCSFDNKYVRERVTEGENKEGDGPRLRLTGAAKRKQGKR